MDRGAKARRGSLPRPLSALCFLLILFSPAQLHADLATEYGFSPRAISMGNAFTALADDISGYYFNPAGPATNPRDTLTLGYLYNQPRVRVRGADGSEHTGFDAELKGGLLGFSLDVGQWLPKRFRRPWVMGIATVFPDDFKTYVNADIRFFDEPQFPVFGRVHDLSAMFLGGGIQLHRMVYVGASVRVAFTADIRNLTLRYDVTDIRHPVLTFDKLDINPDLEVQPIVGVMLNPWEDLKVGAAWRKGGSPVTFLGAVDVTVTGIPLIGSLTIPSFAMFVMEFYNPEEIAVSIAYRPFERLLVAVEGTYALWSHYDLPYGRILPGKPFEDILIPRVGVEVMALKDLAVRLGYYYQPSPLKSVQPFTRLMDTDQHVFSAGLGYAWRWPAQWIAYPLEFDLYLQYKHLPRRTLQMVTASSSPETVTIWGRHLNVGGSVRLQF